MKSRCPSTRPSFAARTASRYALAFLYPSLAFFIVQSAALTAADANELELRERAGRLHAETPLIDGHNDLPRQIFRRADGDLDRVDIVEPQPRLHTDLSRMREGGLGTQIWAAYVAVFIMRKGRRPGACCK